MRDSLRGLRLNRATFGDLKFFQVADSENKDRDHYFCHITYYE